MLNKKTACFVWWVNLASEITIVFSFLLYLLSYDGNQMINHFIFVFEILVYLFQSLSFITIIIFVISKITNHLIVPANYMNYYFHDILIMIGMQGFMFILMYCGNKGYPFGKLVFLQMMTTFIRWTWINYYRFFKYNK